MIAGKGGLALGIHCDLIPFIIKEVVVPCRRGQLGPVLTILRGAGLASLEFMAPMRRRAVLCFGLNFSLF